MININYTKNAEFVNKMNGLSGGIAKFSSHMRTVFSVLLLCFFYCLFMPRFVWKKYPNTAPQRRNFMTSFTPSWNQTDYDSMAHKKTWITLKPHFYTDTFLLDAQGWTFIRLLFKTGV